MNIADVRERYEAKRYFTRTDLGLALAEVDRLAGIIAHLETLREADGQVILDTRTERDRLAAIVSAVEDERAWFDRTCERNPRQSGLR